MSCARDSDSSAFTVVLSELTYVSRNTYYMILWVRLLFEKDWLKDGPQGTVAVFLAFSRQASGQRDGRLPLQRLGAYVDGITITRVIICDRRAARQRCGWELPESKE